MILLIAGKNQMKPNMKVVGDLSNIVSISGDPIQQPDPVFFKKNQITIGTELVYYGRHAPGTKWKVARILHFYNEVPSRKNHWEGRLRFRRVEQPQTLNDALVLHCENGARMELTFQYVSYSAIWRLT